MPQRVGPIRQLAALAEAPQRVALVTDRPQYAGYPTRFHLSRGVAPPRLQPTARNLSPMCAGVPMGQCFTWVTPVRASPLPRRLVEERKSFVRADEGGLERQTSAGNLTTT
jgi:hypothetical protein